MVLIFDCVLKSQGHFPSHWWPGLYASRLQQGLIQHSILRYYVIGRYGPAWTKANAGPLGEQETSHCSLKATYACKMKFLSTCLTILRGSPNETLVLSLLPSTKCCKWGWQREYTEPRHEEGHRPSGAVYLHTPAIPKFHTCHISQDGCHREWAPRRRASAWGSEDRGS